MSTNQSDHESLTVAKAATWFVCQQCQRGFPPSLLREFRAIECKRRSTRRICPICALTEKNRIHGLSDEAFEGLEAEQLRLQAIKWLRTRDARG